MVTGSSDVMDVLEQFCRNYSVAAERGVVSAYEGVAVTMFAVYLTARLDVLSQCISAYRSSRKAVHPAVVGRFQFQRTGSSRFLNRTHSRSRWVGPGVLQA